MLLSSFFLTLISYADDRSPVSSLSGCLKFNRIAFFYSKI